MKTCLNNVVCFAGSQYLKTTAIIDKRFESSLKGRDFVSDYSAQIKLEEYAPNRLKYNYQANKDQLAVFSEVYYDKGWNAYLDGEKVPYVRANYILRAMELPSGTHSIEFKFEPKVWMIGEKVSFASSLLLILLLIGAVVQQLRTNKKTEVKEPLKQ